METIIAPLPVCPRHRRHIWEILQTGCALPLHITAPASPRGSFPHGIHCSLQKNDAAPMAQCRFAFCLSFVTFLRMYALSHHLITRELSLVDDPLYVRGIIHVYDVFPFWIVDAKLISPLIQYQESIPIKNQNIARMSLCFRSFPRLLVLIRTLSHRNAAQ